MIKICAISDLHGILPEIRECDVVFICGDTFPLEVQRINTESEAWFLSEFKDWVVNLPCKKVYFIGGNHCFWLERMGYNKISTLINSTEGLKDKLVYLKDNLIEIEGGLTVYGCPWCEGPRGWAFIDYSGSKYNDIPDCDILLTHQPPSVNKLGCSYPNTWQEECFGSYILKDVIKQRKIRYNFCGHIHTGTHEVEGLLNCDTLFYNVSLLDEDYKVAYEPLYLEIEENNK